MSSRFTTILFLGLFCSSLHAEDRNDVLGFWASEGSIFMIYEEAEQLHGEIVALEKAYYTAEERPDAVGQPRLDDNNPDEVLSKQPIVGLQMFTAYEFDKGQWQGKIYDPESGNSYQSKMKLSKKGKLEIRGYIGVPMFGRTSTFDPVSSCQPHIVAMLTSTEHGNQC